MNRLRAQGAPLNLSPAQFSRLSQLLDQCIDMAPEERDSWLAALVREDPESAMLLRALFASQAADRNQGFLEARDVVARNLGSIADGQSGLVGKHFGPYRVVSLLGRGGMGSVWLAERADGLFERQVALKLIHPALLGQVTSERFAREREILASLSHPNIARLFDAGHGEDGQPYIALEYISGAPLTTYCDNHRLSIEARLKLFTQVLRAVQYAHAHLVVHRDLKPSNILVTADGHTHLLDFGIAKLMSESQTHETELTHLGGRVLTPDYASPEQVAGAPITTATDVYALGIMLYELLTGERPYRLKRESRAELEDAILNFEPVRPSRAALTEAAARARGTSVKKLAAALRGELDTITEKAVQKSPADRYATANAFADDIDRYLRGEVVLAQRDRVAYRALKFARRHRVGIAAAFALLATLAGGLAVMTYEARSASIQRDAALAAQLRLLTLTAAARLKDNDMSGAMGIALDVLLRHGTQGAHAPEALSVFEEVLARDTQLLVLSGHTDWVRSAEFSSDGRNLITASHDKTARIWDASSGRQLTLLTGHTDRLRSASFSPDGRRAVTASSDKTARIWDVASGRELLLLRGHAGEVRSAHFSPDGERLVTASSDGTARIWNAATGALVLQLRGHNAAVASAAFSSDGGRVVTSSADRTARIWDARTGRQLRVLSGHDGSLLSANFSPDGTRIVTACDDRTARIWDAKSGRVLKFLAGHTQELEDAAFSPDGRLIVTTSFDKTARIWDASSGREITVFGGHRAQVLSGRFSPDGKRIATASSDGTARVWGVWPTEHLMQLSGHTRDVAGADYSPDGRLIATASIDKTARVWDAATGGLLVLLRGHAGFVFSAEFSPDGRRVATASNDGTARIWDSATGRELLRVSHGTLPVEGALFSPDGRRLLTASDDKTARIWDASTGRELTVLRGHTARVSWAEFSPDGGRVVTSSWDKTARVWDAATGRQLIVLRGHTDSLATAAFAPDGGRVVTASDDRTARVWDVTTGREMLLLRGHSQVLNSAAFSRDGRRIVTASNDGTARIWDATSGQLLMVAPHSDHVDTAVFSPDGLRILTASDDTAAHVWNARTLALEAQIRWAEAAEVDPLSPGDRSVLGLSSDTRAWPNSRSRCDELSGAPYDPDRRARGSMLDQIVPDVARAACAEHGTGGEDLRSAYELGRAEWAGGARLAAEREFQRALSGGYRAAAIDLARLLASTADRTSDVARAIALGERAWQEGVTIAAFDLGNMYEGGVRRTTGAHEYLLRPDVARAGYWYRKAAGAGVPYALARAAELAEGNAKQVAHDSADASGLLDAFRNYAAAVARASVEDWPEDPSSHWRYRRASLARVLAQRGSMQQVAEVYAEVRRRYAER